MEARVGDTQLMQELLRRMAALEDNLAFLEVWCEEQQDALDRMGVSDPVFFVDDEDEEPAPVHLRVVDLRECEPIEETDYDRKVRQLRHRIRRLRNGLPASSGTGTLVRTD
jgi:hypothetical protein